MQKLFKISKRAFSNNTDIIKRTLQKDIQAVTNLNEIQQENQKAFLEENFNLHFPSTHFGSRKNQNLNEERYSSLLTDQLYNWQYFTRGPNGFQQRPTWVIHDGPPFTNGKSHVGNMYNKVLKDVINRYKLLRGYKIHYVPGFDCFGTHNEDFFAFETNIASQLESLDLSLIPSSKNEQMSQKERQIMAIRKTVEQGVKDSMMVQMAELQKWGIMTDWRYSYFTMQIKYQTMVLKSFQKFIKKGLVFRGDRPIFWSVQQQKVLANDEMVKKSEIRDCLVMKLPLSKFGKKSKNIQELYPDAKLLVFCTEPWRVTGMKAVGINENVLYVLAKHNQDYVILAEKRLGELQMRTGKPFKKLLTFNGDALDEISVMHPINDSEIPILINNEISSEFGTGADCVSPAHDLDSLKIAYHYGLEKSGYVTEEGLFDDKLGPVYENLSVFSEDTNKLIAGMLREDDRLFTQYPYKNEFFEHEKTGEKIILRSQKSWFVNISDKMKMRCMEELSTTRFVPKLNLKDTEETHQDYKKMKKGKKQEVDSYYINIVEELNDFNDWCISDNNSWGIPIPFFTYKASGNILLDPEILDYFISLVESYGTSDIWYTFDIVDLLPPRYKDQAKQLEKQYQVFDSWFDSSLSWNQENDMQEDSLIYQKIVENIKSQKLVEVEAPTRGRGRKTSQQKSQVAVQNPALENTLVDAFPTQLLQSFKKQDVLASQPITSSGGGNFPANLYLEGCDQHSRWFLCSLVTSVALTKKAPFLGMKTHGLILDESQDKMSKSYSDLIVDPEDLISGSEKLDGNRAHGYGTDAVRLWAVTQDGDKNFEVKQEELAKSSDKVKIYRQMVRQILGNLNGFQKEKVKFEELTLVDKMMMIEIGQFLTKQQEIMDTKIDLAGYQENLEKFMISKVINFYMEFSKNRLLTQKGSKEFLSSQSTLLTILNTLMVTASPVLIYTCQELFDHMPLSLFEIKPKTVFQLPWPQVSIDNQFMAKFELRTHFETLMTLRESLRLELQNPTLKSYMRGQGDLKGLEFVVLTESPDSETATLFESLDEDLNEFFFGAKVKVLSEEENEKERSNTQLPRGCQTPIKVFTFQDDIKIQIYKSANIKCIRCQKYTVEPISPNVYKQKPVMEKICPNCQTFLNYNPAPQIEANI